MSDETKEEIKTVNIMGNKWTIKIVPDDPAFETARGLTDDGSRIITIQAVQASDDPLAYGLHSQYVDQKRVIRHEVIHAYLFECGLAYSSSSTDNWAANEEMVDWFARIGPRIAATWKELKV